MPDLLTQLVPRAIRTLLPRENPLHEAKRQLSWIQDCLDNHTICNKNALEKSSYLSTRLVDIRNMSCIQLIDSNAIITHDRRYAALSYCWVNSMPKSGRTTLSSLAAHQRQIEVKKLPKTLREAIEVTRSLKIDYIWIDALCIIQDDEVDREREITSMVEVYSCGIVTIAAGVSTSCESGFLMANRHLFRLSAKSRPRETGQRFSPAESENPFFSNSLFRRGWTLQERELSTRVLNFTSTNVVFECRQGIKRYEIGTASYYYPSMPFEHSHWFPTEPKGWRHRILDLEDPQKSFVPLWGTESSTEVNWHMLWWKTIEEYSKREDSQIRVTSYQQ